MSKDLKTRSRELICWLTADWVTWLICAALVKLSVSAKSQKTFRLSICIRPLNIQIPLISQLMFCSMHGNEYTFSFGTRDLRFQDLRLSALFSVSILEPPYKLAN